MPFEWRFAGGSRVAHFIVYIIFKQVYNAEPMSLNNIDSTLCACYIGHLMTSVIPQVNIHKTRILWLWKKLIQFLRESFLGSIERIHVTISNFRHAITSYGPNIKSNDAENMTSKCSISMDISIFSQQCHVASCCVYSCIDYQKSKKQIADSHGSILTASTNMGDYRSVSISVTFKVKNTRMKRV